MESTADIGHRLPVILPEFLRKDRCAGRHGRRRRDQCDQRNVAARKGERQESQHGQQRHHDQAQAGDDVQVAAREQAAQIHLGQVVAEHNHRE